MSGRYPIRRLVSGVLVAFAPAVARSAEQPLRLDDAITMALEKNEAIVVERELVHSATAAIDGARGAYDPFLQVETGWLETSLPVNSAFSGAPEGELSPTDERAQAVASIGQLLATGGRVSLTADAARLDTDAGFTLLSPAYDTGLGVELRQPLLRNRAIDPARLTVRQAAADHRRSTAALASVVNDVIGAVEQAYWALASARRGIEVREEAVRLAEEQLEETAIRIEGGAAPEAEIAQPRAELERRRGELYQAREEAVRVENGLKLLILEDGDEALWSDRLVPSDETPDSVESVDTNAAMRRALASRPEIEGGTALVERREAEADFAHNALLPSLDAVVSYGRFGLAGSANPNGTFVPGLDGDIPPELEGGAGQSFDTLVDGDFDETRVALVLGIPLGNRAAKAADEEARSAVRRATAELEGLRKAIRAQVLDAVAALATTGQRIEATRAARAAAEVQLSAEQDRYAAGLSTNFLVLTRQNELSEARLAEIDALTDHRSARVELARATGALVSDHGIELAPMSEEADHPTGPGADPISPPATAGGR